MDVLLASVTFQYPFSCFFLRFSLFSHRMTKSEPDWEEGGGKNSKEEEKGHTKDEKER